MIRALLLLLALGGVAVVVALASKSSHVGGRHFGSPRPGGRHFISPQGSDRHAGTAGSPWRTLSKALSAARPGDTVVFLPGRYGAYGRRTNWTASGRPDRPITLEGQKGTPKPTILGYNKIAGSHLRILNLSFRAPTGPVDPRTADNPGGEESPLWIAGDDVELARCEVAGSRWHAGIYVTGPSDVRIIANYIHDNGDFSNPAQANLDQGIYWGHGSVGLIADNLIVHNLANGIQLYPVADSVTVEQNTIVGNGKSGVIIGDQSSGNVVVNNIVYGNIDNSIRSFDLSGTDNVVRNNLVWDNGSGDIGNESAGLTMIGNIQADPRFVGGGDYRLRAGSPALGRALRLPETLLYDIRGPTRGKALNVGAY